jgi:hypothetical protein
MWNGNRQRRRLAAAAALIVPMSLQPAIPWRGALQQSPPPLRRPDSFCNSNARSPKSFQRTATCPFFACLDRGVQCNRRRASSLFGEERGTNGTTPPIDAGWRRTSTAAQFDDFGARPGVQRCGPAGGESGRGHGAKGRHFAVSHRGDPLDRSCYSEPFTCGVFPTG